MWPAAPATSRISSRIAPHKPWSIAATITIGPQKLDVICSSMLSEVKPIFLEHCVLQRAHPTNRVWCASRLPTDAGHDDGQKPFRVSMDWQHPQWQNNTIYWHKNRVEVDIQDIRKDVSNTLSTSIRIRGSLCLQASLWQWCWPESDHENQNRVRFPVKKSA